ncbi:MAG: hydrogenase expression/formation protein HypE [Candidatus Tritonobacter lacicola]|nr:hydrogenase expression/formation protein HypE [Candidatus Tritonobacter lacicola]
MDNERIINLSHGSGGSRTLKLIKEVFAGAFRTPQLLELDDAAVMDGETVFTTDSYVVRPIFYPGGDIGSLSIYGTVNDLVVMGARPLFVSSSFIIEEGFEIAALKKIALSMQDAAGRAGVSIVTGDTKVVERGNADGLYITTAGIGKLIVEPRPCRERIEAGNKIILTGYIADHGLAVILARGELNLTADIKSDAAPLTGLLLPHLDGSVRFMRDPTRGGVAMVLNEAVDGMDFGILIEEEAIPLRRESGSLCEILGFDPLYIGNEGKAVIFVSGDSAESLLEKLRQHPLGKESSIIGEVTEGRPGKVVMQTATGGLRIIDMPVGEQLPRIC